MSKVRTRFAPSPTGYMHIGNLRTALYAYLLTKHMGGDYILRIEDTDQERYVDGAVDLIYRTLKETGIKHDEGPDVGGDYGPYIQSERRNIYKEYAEKLVELGGAYYCFCDKERLDKLKEAQLAHKMTPKYDGCCRGLSKEEIEEKLKAGVPYVIRQKIDPHGTTSFEDAVFGKITVENSTLDDNVLLKSDGLPTYNFANVVDDHPRYKRQRIPFEHTEIQSFVSGVRLGNSDIHSRFADYQRKRQKAFKARGRRVV